MNKIEMFFRAIFGVHSINDGSTCEISSNLFDVHDFSYNKGGDGVPSHFHTYKCTKCNKQFSI